MRIAVQSLISFAIFLALIFSAAASAQDPKAVVETATQGVIGELTKLDKEDRTEEQIRRLVMTYIVPAIDQEKIAKGALGKHWKRATEEQQAAFIDNFRELQIRTYTGAFKAFNGEEFSFEAAKFNKKGNRALVKGKLVQNNGSVVPIDFRLYQNKQSQQWLVYDAVVAGLGMVKTYRQQLSERLQTISIADLLVELSQAETQQASR
ncbi:phospholipid-binding protein MlaC [Bacterioplanoides sp. SCSIO 12839]|uniref:MlaC/ttg2D family ABC transporter substrate-binding protein n=1 Tax=Bacterioplanoides sp. SCSIO 12839 TaxID=2829569 RepID=UPI0021023F5A|nr:ABC transporter substrate-binding protein [Bacterioplanoides sp. SCSIO 12839]UTW47902.1 ABC transporter substrate-binding protein [Bacterioplanoides sp. SCSIO 12839]